MSRTKYYLINSTTTHRERDGYWTWINPVNYPSSIDYKNVSVIQVAMTLSYHNFYNENIIWQEYGGDNHYETIEANVPNGNYSQNQLANVLEEVMNDNSFFDFTYNWSYNSENDQFIITSNANSFEFLDGSINQFTGFESNAGHSHNQESTLFTNMNKYTNLYLKSNINSNDIYSTMKGRPTSTLCVIPIKGNSGDIIHVEYPNPIKIKTASNFDSISFRLESLDGKQVDLRGGHWTAVLKVDY